MNGHSGPEYTLPQGAEMDKGSQTYDNARGGHTVKWVDGLNQEHIVDLSDKLEVSITFPVAYGGNWNWQQGDGNMERTGFNAAVSWVVAQFTKMNESNPAKEVWGNMTGQKLSGPYVRISATGFRTIPTDEGTLSLVKDRVTDVKDFAHLGAQTAEEILKIAGAAGMLVY